MQLLHRLRRVLLAALMMAPVALSGQQVVLYQDAERDFEALVKEYEQGFYGRTIRSAEAFAGRYPEPAYERLNDEATLYRYRAAMRLDVPGTIEEIMEFVAQRQPGAAAQSALFLVADHAYAQQQYDEAVRYFGMIDERHLDAVMRNERNFKTGYVHFVKKEFEQAAAYLRLSREVRDKFYYPSNYYYGMTQYFLENYPEAVRSFERVAVSDYFKDHVPYYITQIHFATGKYKDVIGYGEQALKSETVLNGNEIHQLVGRAYFETGRYAEAIPHLEIVEAANAKLQPDDFYQLGMAYYYTGQYDKAIPPLLAIRQESGLKAQYANYYLGQCYLRTGDRTSARNALQLAASRTDDPALAAEATFHYGRLSAELGVDAEAIRVLQTIPESSPFHADAQDALVAILVNTRDYGLAIRELEAMPSLTPKLRGAYQNVCLLRAEQLLQDEKPEEARVLLDKSLKYKERADLEARAYFWKGEIAFNTEAYSESSGWLDKYFTAVPRADVLPPAQQPYVAHYTQGYNRLRGNDVANAQASFEKSLEGIRALPADVASTPLVRQQLLPDVLLRAGDCAFKRNQYDKAIGYYDQSIRGKYAGFDYARYQTGIIRGLQKQTDQKIATLESLAADMPDSRWADDALIEAGETYQDQGRSDKAVQAYQRVVDRYGTKSPLLYTALLRMGLIAYNAGRYEEALRHYKAVFTYKPDPETAREALAAIQEIYVSALDQPDDFFAFTETIPGFAVSVTEKDSIQYFAAEDHYAQGDYGRAVESFDRYIKANPTGAYVSKARFLKAESLSLQKNFTDALTAYEAVGDAGPGPYQATALYKAALIAHNDRKDYALALRHYQAYVPLAEDDNRLFAARVGIMRCAYALRQRDVLDAVVPDILAAPAATPDILATAHYYAGSMAYDAKADDTALTHYNALITLNSGEWAAEARCHVAEIYARQGENELAEKLAEEAARANAGYPTWVARALMLLSDMRFTANDLLNARAILEAIVENFTTDETIRTEAEKKLALVKAEEDRQSRIKPDGGETLDLQPNPKKD